MPIFFAAASSEGVTDVDVSDFDKKFRQSRTWIGYTLVAPDSGLVLDKHW